MSSASEERERRPQPRARIGPKLVLSFAVLVMVVVGTSGWVLYEMTRRSLEAQTRGQLVSVAQSGRSFVSGREGVSLSKPLGLS